MDEALRGHLSDRLFDVETINSKTALSLCIPVAHGFCEKRGVFIVPES